ncbi:hypothetical protein EC973_009114, partial [Apophysomyces ossiformis]
LLQQQKKWAGLHTEKYAHFGARTTQRTEDMHRALKYALETPGSLLKQFNSLDIWLAKNAEEHKHDLNQELHRVPVLPFETKHQMRFLLGR